MCFDLQSADSVDDLSVFHCDELVAIGIADIERIGVVHRETGSRRQMQRFPFLNELAGLSIPEHERCFAVAQESRGGQ